MYLRAFCFAGLLVSCLAPWRVLAITPKPIVHDTAFAQLSSKVDQQPGKFVQFESKDSLHGITATANSVTVMQGGTYLIVASSQVTATKDGGCLDAWIVLNGQGVKNSGVRICQAKAGNTNVVVSQLIMKLKKGDTIQVKTSGSNALLDSIAPTGKPLIPSIIFTMWGLF